MKSFFLSLLLPVLWLLTALPAPAASAVFYSVAKSGQDARHATAILPITAWQGTEASWRIGVLRNDGTLDPLTGVTSLSLTVTSYGGTKPGAFPWITKSIPAASFTTPSTADAVRAGTEWHAQFDLSSQEMTLPVEDAGTRAYWYEVRAVSGDGSETMLTAGQLMVRGTSGKPDTRYATLPDVAGKKTRFEAANIAALKIMATAGAVSGELARVRGYYTEADGAEGDFAWDPNSTEPDDGGMVIAPAAGTGRWKRVAKLDRVKALWWGLKVNSQDDQTVLIQNILTKVSNAGGGIVELPPGTFKIGIPNQPLRVLGSNVTLEGKGRRATILQQTKGLVQQTILEFGDEPQLTNGYVNKNVTVRDIGFDMNNNRSCKGIRFRYPVDGVIIENCDAWNSPLENGTETYHNNGDDQFLDMSVRISGIRNVWIKGCRAMYCVQLTSNAGGGVDGLYIIDNLIQDPVAYGVAITGILREPGFEIRNVHISGNTFKNVPHGINIGRDQTANFEVAMTNDQQIVKNITIDNNIFVVGGPYGGNASNGISVCVYQNEISGVRIANNIVQLADGTTLSGQVGIQVTVYEFNWLVTHHSGVAPVIASVNTTTETITTDKDHYLFNNMQVRFEPATRGDTLPAPLIPNRRYLLQRVDGFNFTLTDMRTGGAVNLASAQTGTVKVLFAPCVRDVEVDGNTVTGFSEAIRINAGAGVGIRDNRCNGSIYISPGSIVEDIEVRNNLVTKGGITSLGNVINGRMIGNSIDSNDGYFTASGVRLMSFAPAQAVWNQDWIVRDNKIDLIRLDGNNIFRVVSGFAANLGQGQVTLREFDGNTCSSTVPRPFDDLLGSNVMVVKWGDNKVRDASRAFKANSPELQSRLLASTTLDTSLKDAQADAEASGKSLFPNALIMEGRASSAQATATLTGVSFGGEGRAVSWRHRVSNRTSITGLWSLGGSATNGHAANALYAMEQNGILTIRQIGTNAGSIVTNPTFGAIGDVSGADLRQAVVDVTARRGLPTHFLISIDRTGALLVYVEGIPVAVNETTAGSAPAWNNASLPAGPLLNLGFVSTTLPTFEGAFYSFDVLNFAPTSSQAQSLFAGGVAAVPGYGLRNPAEKISNGAFASSTGWTFGLEDCSITGGTANFDHTVDGGGFSQNVTADYRKGRYYRLKFDVTSYTSGVVYFNIGGVNLVNPLTPNVGSYFYEALAGESSNIFTFRSFGAGLTASFDNISVVPLGAVASYSFAEGGPGYQVEDKSELQNHLYLSATGVGWLRPSFSGRWGGKVSAATSNYIGRNGIMMETGHVITKISAYSASGGTFSLGEAAITSTASLVASTSITAGTWTDLTLLKRVSGSQRVWAQLGTATDLQVNVEYALPRLN